MLILNFLKELLKFQILFFFIFLVKKKYIYIKIKII